jgi:hypothetical protein
MSFWHNQEQTFRPYKTRRLSEHGFPQLDSRWDMEMERQSLRGRARSRFALPSAVLPTCRKIVIEYI